MAEVEWKRGATSSGGGGGGCSRDLHMNMGVDVDRISSGARGF